MIQASQATGGVDDFVSAASFWSPETMAASAWHQHAPFAFWLVGALRPRVFVELGAHNGFSYLSLCQAAERLGLDAKGYAIDTWQGDDHAGFYDDEVYAKLRERHDNRFGGFSLLIRSSFDDALSRADKTGVVQLVDARRAPDSDAPPHRSTRAS